MRMSEERLAQIRDGDGGRKRKFYRQLNVHCPGAGSSHNNQSPTRLPPSILQVPSKQGLLLSSLHTHPFAWG